MSLPIPINDDPFKGAFLVDISFANQPVHVFPVDDMYPHDTEHFFKCHCTPCVSLVNNTFIVSHHAFDHRP